MATTMMDELIRAVARSTALSHEQAAQAVAAVLRFFTARLPSALVGELHVHLRGNTHEDNAPTIPPHQEDPP